MSGSLTSSEYVVPTFSRFSWCATSTWVLDKAWDSTSSAAISSCRHSTVSSMCVLRGYVGTEVTEDEVRRASRTAKDCAQMGAGGGNAYPWTDWL